MNCHDISFNAYLRIKEIESYLPQEASPDELYELFSRITVEDVPKGELGSRLPTIRVKAKAHSPLDPETQRVIQELEKVTQTAKGYYQNEPFMRGGDIERAVKNFEQHVRLFSQINTKKANSTLKTAHSSLIHKVKHAYQKVT